MRVNRKTNTQLNNGIEIVAYVLMFVLLIVTFFTL